MPDPAMIDILVAGGGIAGLTAGLTAARLGRATLVLSGEMLGGQLASIGHIDGWPGTPQGIAGYELCPQIQEQAAEAGAEFLPDNLAALAWDNGAWTVTTESGERLSARAVILAMGAALRPLGIPGEARLRGHGVSQCADCDGPLLRGRAAVVVGGGDSALQEALALAEFAASVTILHRDTACTAQHAYRAAAAAHPRITQIFGVEAAEILGNDGVTGIRLTNGDEIPASGVFAYIGLAPNSAALNALALPNATGHIPTDATLRTALPRLFAAGALREGWAGRAVLAAAEGAQAAISAHKALSDPAPSA